MSIEPLALGERVLVVDDDPGILRAVARVLGRGHHVTCAASGAEALREAARVRPDLAVVDIRLPDQSGFEVTHALKATMPDVDVILMTGNAEEPDENLIRAIDEGAFYFIQKPFDRRVLLALATRCLELRRLRGERERYLTRVEAELDEARRFQLSLLPPPRLDLPGLSITARYLACNELAGDIYDYVATDDGGAALLIADVVGHGTSAAMMTGIVTAAFRASHVDRFAPLAVIGRVRAGLRNLDPSRFVTLCCARFDPRRRALTYVNAGHPEPIARTGRREPVLLETTGPFLSSLFSEFPCEQATLTLEPGDSLLFYTDGVTDVRGPDGMYGFDRLVSALMGGQRRGSELLDAVLAEISAYSGSESHQDDVTILTMDLAAA
jgi:sigma-B regulation protein RsbU (phosphoserine phosphatase)